MKKIAFSGFMASILMASGAAFADSAALTTQGYVDSGLRAVYKAVDNVKADKTTVATLNGTVQTLSDVVTDANSGLGTKASQADLTTLSNTVNNAETGLATKASATTVATLQEQVASLTNSVDGIAYTGQGGIAVDNANNTIGMNIENYNANSTYVYKDGGWKAITIESAFPQNFNFADTPSGDDPQG